jgi:hypothetical protein
MKEGIPMGGGIASIFAYKADFPLVIDIKDRDILRQLAFEIAQAAGKPEMSEKAKLWTLHNDLKTDYPVILLEPENGWPELLPDSDLKCKGILARQWEQKLRKDLYWVDIIRDDHIIDLYFDVPFCHTNTGWGGVTPERVGGGSGGSYKIIKVIEDYETEFDKIKFPEIIIDFKSSMQLLEIAHETIGDILAVRQYTKWWWTLGMTWDYIDLRGLEDFLCDFMCAPEWVHRMMDFLCEGHLREIDSLEQQGLLSSNVGNENVGSGGLGFTSELPGYEQGRRVSTKDMWGFVESQETAMTSPEVYKEFILPYHIKIAERFGLNCFGCCEPYDERFKYAREIPRLRRVSCSPWSNRSLTRELLSNKYVASHKLSPWLLAMPKMNEDSVRKEIRDVLENSSGCIPELVMKDLSTFGKNPLNASRWVEIAREEVTRLYD